MEVQLQATEACKIIVRVRVTYSVTINTIELDYLEEYQ